MYVFGLGSLVDTFIASIDRNPWSAHAGSRSFAHKDSGVSSPAGQDHTAGRRPLYTAEQRLRRDRSRWTVVQGILAPVQFLVFLISLALVTAYLATGDGYGIATASIVIKTIILYAIMITGSIWEREVFGRYLFAPAFFWEDVVSVMVMALHTLYIAALLTGALGPVALMWLALAAYAAYVINAAQYLVKFRAARRESAGGADSAPPSGAIGII